VWNCNESGAKAKREGGGFVIAKRVCRSIHKVITDYREWITVVSCINARGEALPNFYVFKCKRKTRNYLKKTGEKNAIQVIQIKAWMTCDLFMEWMHHFFSNVSKMYDISPTRRHVLILNGHGSHVTKEIIKFAMSHGLDLVTLPSHTSHALQSLDVCRFKPFKQAFRDYRDKWSLSHKGQVPIKEDLA